MLYPHHPLNHEKSGVETTGMLCFTNTVSCEREIRTEQGKQVLDARAIILSDKACVN